MVRAISIIVLVLLVFMPLVGAIPALYIPEFISLTLWLKPVSYTAIVTLVSGLLVIYLSLVCARYIAQSRWFGAMSVTLATPHVAFAVGIMFLLSPSGYLVRLLEAFTGSLSTPPAGWPLPEKSLLTLTLVLVIKEIPFMLLMISTQLKQLPYKRWLLQAQSLGWSEERAWWCLVVPELLSRLKLPLAAIIIYTVSVVDVPLLLGPNAPGLLATVVYEQHYQWGRADQTALGVLLLIGMSIMLLAMNALLIRTYRYLSRVARLRIQKATQRRQLFSTLLSRGFVLSIITVSIAVLVLLTAQSFAGAWFYPSLLPSSWQPARWATEWPYIAPLLWSTLWLAILSGIFAVIAAVIVLERQRQTQQTQLKILPLLMLLMPQLVLVLGWQRMVGQGSYGPVLLWAHVVFAFPYAYLVMHGAWVNLSERWLYQAQSLGYSYPVAWFKIVLPMLKTPLLTAFVLTFSVSVAQYLPTLWLAGGTLPTLTTEAVSIASGGDWRLASLYALMQASLPLLLFAMLLIHQHRQRGTHASY